MKFSLGFIRAALRASLVSVPCAAGVEVNATDLTPNAQNIEVLSQPHGLSLTTQ
jgi:hypothetical protein